MSPLHLLAEIRFKKKGKKRKKAVLFRAAHPQRARVGSVRLSVVQRIPLVDTGDRSIPIGGSQTVKKKNRFATAHQDREGPRAPRAAPLGQLRLHPSFGSQNLEAERKDGFSSRLTSASGFERRESHLQGRRLLLVAEEGVGADAGFGFTLALLLIRRQDRVLFGPVGLEDGLSQVISL